MAFRNCADIKSGNKVIISSHGNTIRSLVKYLDNLSSDGVVSLNIPTSIPLVYELDENLRPIRHYYLSMDGEVPEGEIPKIFLLIRKFEMNACLHIQYRLMVK